MASSSTEVETDEQHPFVGRTAPPIPPAPMEEWFDRSSIAIDAMVTIEGVSEEDWWRFAPEGRACEYLDGVVYMPSPASEEHQDEVGFWHVLLRLFLECRGGRERVVRLGPGVLRLAPGRNTEPDVFVVPSGRGPHHPPAHLVVEVLSKSTRRHDLDRKAAYFQQAAIPEIVYVDQRKKRLITFRRGGDVYHEETIEQGAWLSTALPGFWVDTEWLWRDPLPGPLECLQRILAGPPA